MGYWMYDAKRKAASVVKKDTHKIDLPTKGLLSSIYISLAAQNGATSNEDNHLHDCLTKIEIVGAGGETIKSISGVQLQALNWFDHGHINRVQMREDGGQWQVERFIINFGEYWKDTHRMLDCAKVLDGQLRLTYDLSQVRAVGATAFADQNAALSVIYMMPHEYKGPAPVNYVKSTETKQWMTEASGIEYVKLPRVNPIRRIMIRAYEVGRSPWSNLRNIKLNGDNGKYVPYDNSYGTLVSLNADDYREVWNYMQLVLAKNGDTKEIHLGSSQDVTLQPTAARSAYPAAEAYGKVTIGLYDLATPTAIAVKEPVHLSCHGHHYHNCAMLPFDRPAIIEELLLQAQGFGTLELEIAQGNAGAAASVVTEELVKQT